MSSRKCDLDLFTWALSLSKGGGLALTTFGDATPGGQAATTVGRVPKKKHGPSKPSSRRSGHPARRSSPQQAGDDWNLLDEAEAALSTDHPLPMLQLSSALLDLLRVGDDDPFDGPISPESVPLTELLSTFTASEEPAAAALAWTMAHMSGDDLVRTRVVRDLGARSFLLPSWMHQLTKIEIVAAEQVTDTVRDGNNVVVHVRLDGHDLTAVTFIDFNLGVIVKDNFLSDRTLEDFNEIWQEHADTRHTALEALSPADARARIDHALEAGAKTLAPIESEDWPATRPLLEWILWQMPEGGTGFARPEWSEEDREGLADRFLASPYGATLDQPDDRSIVGNLIWYRTDYGYGDPLRWSPTAIEILMLDWYPRKIMAGQRYMRRMPIVLRDFVRFVHNEIDLDEELTAEALDGIEAFEYEYREAISKPLDLPLQPALL